MILPLKTIVVVYSVLSNFVRFLALKFLLSFKKDTGSRTADFLVASAGKEFRGNQKLKRIKAGFLFFLGYVHRNFCDSFAIGISLSCSQKYKLLN